MNFRDLGLAPPLLRAVEAEGYTVPTPIQAQAIPPALAGEDVLGCAQTGTGKTAAFALPLLHRLQSAPRDGRRARVLVLSPTRELATQIETGFRTYGRHTGLRTVAIYGGVSQNPQVAALRRGVDVLVATPGRLVDLMQQRLIDLRGITAFVLDEADRMLDMGFLPDLRRILDQLPDERQTLLFSATMPPEIARLAKELLDQPVTIRLTPEQPTTELVEQSVCFVGPGQKPRMLTQLLVTRSVSRALVFTRTKHGADRLTKHLLKSGIRAEAIHGNKSQSARQRALENFRADRISVLVATDVAARGIDVDGISHVVNFDLPIEPETYVHRIGRTGRAGAAGIAVSFCDPAERGYLKAIERTIRQRLSVDTTLAVPAPTDAAATGTCRPVDSRPAVSRPVASRPAASRPVDSRPAASRPVASRPAASRPAARTWQHAGARHNGGSARPARSGRRRP